VVVGLKKWSVGGGQWSVKYTAEGRESLTTDH
jgi:hypothetical protein